MPKNKIELKREDILDAVSKCSNWKDTAKHLKVCEDVLRRERNKHNLPQNFESVIVSSEMDVVCLTEIDPKKEPTIFGNFKDLEEKANELDKDFTDSIGYDEIEFKIPNRCGIVFLTDLHIGNKHTNHKKIVDTVLKIKKHKNIFVIDGGDNCDNYDRKMSGLFEQVMSIPEQKEFVKTIIKQLSNRIIGVIQGCHDEWMFNRDEFDLSQYLARHSKGKPLGFGGVITLHVGGQTYKIYARHKINGYTKNSTLASLMKHLGRIKMDDVDIIFSGHFHTYRVDKFMYNGKIVRSMICPAFKITDRFLDRKYGEKSPPNVPMIVLGAKEREILLFDDIDEGLKYL